MEAISGLPSAFFAASLARSSALSFFALAACAFFTAFCAFWSAASFVRSSSSTASIPSWSPPPIEIFAVEILFYSFWGQRSFLLGILVLYTKTYDYDLIQENGPSTHRTFLPETMVKNTRIMNKDDCCHFLHTESPGTMIAGN